LDDTTDSDTAASLDAAAVRVERCPDCGYLPGERGGDDRLKRQMGKSLEYIKDLDRAHDITQSERDYRSDAKR
jgi:hypothetical protein